MGAAQNQQEGKVFETLFQKQGQRLGLLVLKNPLAARFVWSGRTQLVKSQLDFTVIDQTGRTGFFDTKSYVGDKFTFSQLDPKQIDQTILYSEYQVPSGFVVWFRAPNRVVYFKGSLIKSRGPKSSFECIQGIQLGRIESFDLRLALNARP